MSAAPVDRAETLRREMARSDRDWSRQRDSGWRMTPPEAAARDGWKRASRAVMLRVFHRLEDRGLSMADCAEIWDAACGARWYAGILQVAMREVRT